jgi:hypothetical protein
MRLGIVNRVHRDRYTIGNIILLILLSGISLLDLTDTRVRARGSTSNLVGSALAMHVAHQEQAGAHGLEVARPE